MKCITTFGYGKQSDNVRKSAPLFQGYASKHGWDFFIPCLDQFSIWRERHPELGYAWLKIPLIIRLLEIYEFVLWIDADVVIVDDSVCLTDVASDAPMSMVVHNVEAGTHPNTGVWLLRKDARSIIESVDIRTRLPWRIKRWYEQAALHRHFGADLLSKVITVPRTKDWGELPYRYNAIEQDTRGIPRDASFVHAAGIQRVFDDSINL